jgi:hypothetical protein
MARKVLTPKQRKTVAVDLDGVLAIYEKWQGYDHIGEPIKGAIKFTKDLSKHVDILIYSTRCCEAVGDGRDADQLKDIVREWLDKHGFLYYDVWIGQGKPLCSAYIDDRAVSCRPQDVRVPEREYRHTTREVMFLLEESFRKDSNAKIEKSK